MVLSWSSTIIAWIGASAESASNVDNYVEYVLDRLHLELKQDPDNHMLAYVTRRIETECNELQRNFEPFVAILADMVRSDNPIIVPIENKVGRRNRVVWQSLGTLSSPFPFSVMSCLCDYFYYYDHCIDPTIQLW
jgi:hypothetical protein